MVFWDRNDAILVWLLVVDEAEGVMAKVSEWSPLPTTLDVLSKWTAESVWNIFLPSSTFIANTKGYLVFPKPTQSFIRKFMIVNAHFCTPVTQNLPDLDLAGSIIRRSS